MSEHEPDPKIVAFIHKLEELDAGDRARLKRNCGNTLAESRGVLSIFYRILPSDISPFQEELFFLVATLFPLADGDGRGDLGISLKRAQQASNKKGLDRRTEILLDTDITQLPFRLRQTVHFLKSNRVRINWVQLLSDLLYWTHPDRFVQKQWAKSYFVK